MTSLRPLVLASFLLVSAAAQAATVQQFQPQGKVASQTRVTARFSGPLVALGATTAPAPFAIDCAGITGEER